MKTAPGTGDLTAAVDYLAELGIKLPYIKKQSAGVGRDPTNRQLCRLLMMEVVDKAALGVVLRNPGVQIGQLATRLGIGEADASRSAKRLADWGLIVKVWGNPGRAAHLYAVGAEPTGAGRPRRRTAHRQTKPPTVGETTSPHPKPSTKPIVDATPPTRTPPETIKPTRFKLFRRR